jgi:hypothetical protein
MLLGMGGAIAQDGSGGERFCDGVSGWLNFKTFAVFEMGVKKISPTTRLPRSPELSYTQWLWDLNEKTNNTFLKLSRYAVKPLHNNAMLS